jgi:hypothetical protein
MMNKKINLSHTIFHMPVTRLIKLDSPTSDTMYPVLRRQQWQCVSQAAAFQVAVQCWQFPDKNFKYLLISSPGVKYVWEFQCLL